ncbi:hypothetical protein RN001_009898 [Aquatica leii]|uniref:Uncharacterized protein n=1 Tax=Aquatica leii TaxID=1421715 RepID=A0AAN7P5T9_9COLE|nr:hypothetical protein RN001_009898 [Aquatica leii]
MERNILDSGLSQCTDPLFQKYGIRQEDLDRPTKEFVIQTYDRFRGIIKDVLFQIVDEENNNNQELLSEPDFVIELLHFFNNSLMMPDAVLSLTDFYAPTAKRTKSRTRLIVMFVEYYIKQANQETDIVMSRRNQALKMTSLKKDKEDILSELAAIAENIAKEEDEINFLKNELKQSENHYEMLQQLQDDKKQHFKKLQQDLKENILTNENKQILLKNLKANIASANEEVVTKDTYDSLSDLKNNLIKKCEELERNSINISEGLSVRVIDIEYYKSIQKQIDTLSEFGKSLESQKSDFNTIKNKQEQLQTDYNMCVKRLECKHESIVKSKTNFKERNSNIESDLVKNNNLFQQFCKEYKQMNVEVQDEKELHKKLTQDIKVLQQKISNITMKLEKEDERIIQCINSCIGRYARIINAENIFITNYNNMLQHISERTLNGDAD